MRAIILAAGRGTRLAPMELVVPKPMVRVGGVPVLERTIEHFDSLGIRDITITVGYLAPVITEYFGDGRAFGVRISYSFEGEHTTLGTAGGVKHAASYWDYSLTEPFLVWHGDNFSNCRIDRMLTSHYQRDAFLTLVTRWRSDVSHSGIMEWNGDNRVTSFQEKPQGRLGGGWINSGMYLMDMGILRLLPDAGDFGRDVFPSLVKSHGVFAHGLSHDEFFRWYDTPEELTELRRDYK